MTTRTTAQQLPTVDSTLSPPRFVGRSVQLRMLAQALSRPPAMVLIEGEAGIGKSRLVRECLAAAGVRGRRTLLGVCPPYREPSTLAPVVDALRQADKPPGQLRLSDLAGALRPLFPEWGDQLPPTPEPLESVTAARHRLLRALAEMLARLGAEVLVVEDAHWADETSLEFLLFLASQQRPPSRTPRQRKPPAPDAAPPLSIVVTYRSEDVPDGSLLRRLTSGLPTGTSQVRIAVPPLSVPDTAELASSMLRDDVADAFATFLHEHTDGLPLAVEESVRLLDDRSDLVREDGRWVRHSSAALQVPPTVRDSTLERAHRLDQSAQRVLRAAAVLADPVDEPTLAEVSGLAEAAAQAGADRAVSSGLMHESGHGRLAFRHQLSSTAIYEAIPAPERRRLHLRAGQAMQRRDSVAAVKLARHFREAGDLAQWSHHAEQAADLAVAATDHPTAVDLLDELLGAADLPVPDRVRLVRKLGMAVLFMRVAGGDRAWRAAQTLRDTLASPALSTRQRAEVRHVLGRLLNQLGAHAEAFDELTRAVPHLRHRPVEAAHSMNLLGWPRAGPWPVSTHLRWLKRADELPLSAASPAERLSLAIDRATALLQLGSPAGWEIIPQLQQDVATAEERLHLTRGLLNLGDCALRWGRYDQSRQLLHHALELAEAGQYLRIRDCVRCDLARLDWHTGRWDGLAERVRVLAEAEDTMPVAHHEAVLLTALLDAAHGQPRAAEDRLEKLLEEFRLQGAVLQEPAPAAVLARLHLAQADVGAALKATDGPIQAITTKRVWIWAGDIAAARAEALLSAGRADEARRLLTDLGNGLRGRDAPGPRATLATGRALLAEHERDPGTAGEAFARAARAWDALPNPYEALLARERQAACLFSADRAEAGLDLLAQVFDGLTALGATGDADRVARALREHGAARPWRGGRRGYGDQLSPRELEVVRLVVTGKTNREIAQALSKSPGTVAEQLRSAMRKLGVSSRTALAVSAVEAGVVPDA